MDVIHPTILVLIFVTYHNIEGNFLVLITLKSLVCFSLSSFSESAFKLNFSSNQASLLISLFQPLHGWKYPLCILQYLFFGIIYTLIVFLVNFISNFNIVNVITGLQFMVKTRLLLIPLIIVENVFSSFILLILFHFRSIFYVTGQIFSFSLILGIYQNPKFQSI